MDSSKLLNKDGKLLGKGKKSRPYVLKRKRSGSYIKVKKRKDTKKTLLSIGIVVIFLITISFIAYNFVERSENAENTMAIASQPSDSSSQKVTGAQAQDFTLMDINGEKFTLNEYKGKIVILDFMGATCVPCKTQVVELNKVHSIYNDEVKILSISVYGGKGMVEGLQSFAKSFDVNWKIAIDSKGITYKYQVKTIPTTIIIDKEGLIRYQHSGIADSATLVNEIESIL